MRGITIYFIRHGQTDWNAIYRYQGQTDVPLNDVGRAQARRNGEALSKVLAEPSRFDFVSSPLSRAVETMQIMRTAMGLPPGEFRCDDRLKEVHYGHWEGFLYNELDRHDPAGVAARNRGPYEWRPNGGESYADLMVRTDHWLQSVTRDTVVTSHGGVSRTLRGRVLGLPPEEMLRLEVPQDRVLVLREGRIDWI